MKQIDVTSEITKLFFNLFNHVDKITYANNNNVIFKINDVKIKVIYSKSSKKSSCNINIDVEEELSLFSTYMCNFSSNKTDLEWRFKIYIDDDLYVLPKFNRVEEAKLLEDFENMILEYKRSQINNLINLTSEDEEL